jgi:putative nucleotidyltransferase with HDIG domain
MMLLLTISCGKRTKFHYIRILFGISNRLIKSSSYVIFLTMQQRLPRNIVLLSGITLSFIGLAFLFFPQMIFSQLITNVLWFRFLVGGVSLFWGLVNFGWDWQPVSHLWNLILATVNIFGFVFVSYLCLVDKKYSSLVLFLTLFLVALLSIILADRPSPKSFFLRLSTVLFLIPYFIFLWQISFNSQWNIVQSISLLIVSLIFTGFLVLATLLLIFSNNARIFINFQFIFAFPWVFLVALQAFIHGEPAVTFLAGSIALISIFAKRFEQQKVNETSMSPTTLRIFFVMQAIITFVSVGGGIWLQSVPSLTKSIPFSEIQLVFFIFIVVLIPTEFFNRILSGFQNQFESIFIQSSPSIEKTTETRSMLSGGVVTALTQGYSSLAQRSDSLSKIRQSLSGQNFGKPSTAFQGDTTNLAEMSEQLETTLEIPVAAQILVTSLQKAIGCDLCCIFTHSPEEHRLIPIAIAGSDMTVLPARFRLKTSDPLISKAVSARKSILINPGTSVSIKNLTIEKNIYSSLITVPLLSGGFLEGVILLADKRDQFLTSNHLEVSEAAGSQLLAAWSRYDLYRSVVELMSSSTSITGTTDMQTLLNQIAEVSRRILKTRFSAIIISLQEKIQIGYSGNAPELLGSLRKYYNSFLVELTQTSESFTIHDVRKDPRTRRFHIDIPELSSALVSPIRLRGMMIGAVFAFGKRRGITFSEQDGFISNLLSLQATALIEGSLLDQELRANLVSTRLLHGLSIRISQAGDLDSALKAIAETALNLSQATTGGLVLYTLDGNVEAQTFLSVQRSFQEHPHNLIHQAMNTRNLVSKNMGNDLRQVCLPIQTNRRCYGGLWLEMGTDLYENSQLLEELRNLINQASVALERSILLIESRQQADQISEAYYQLQQTYDHTLMALVSAIEMRDRETEGHCIRVAQLAISMGKELGLSQSDLKALERGSLLHDIGKIGISDAVLHKPGSLTAEEWKIMRQHPHIGAQIIQNIPFLRDAVRVVANHQERWDGSGYPHGIKGEAIPLLARIFSVADVFDALISDRPYHEKVSPQDAFEFLKFQTNIQFDPKVIKVFTKLYEKPNFLKNLGFHEL